MTRSSGRYLSGLLENEFRVSTALALPVISSFNVLLGGMLVGLGVALSGSFGEAVNTIVVGVFVSAAGGYNLFRIATDRLKHPNCVRFTVLLGLWLVGVSLHWSPGALSQIGLAVGLLIAGINSVDFVRRFKNRPVKRRIAQRQTEGLVSVVKTIVHSIPATDRRTPATTFVYPVLLAIPIGVGAGIGAAAFRFLMFAIHNFLFGTVLSLFPSRYWIVLLPATGAGIAGVLIYEFAPEAAGHGVPENMEAIAADGGRIRHRLAPFKVLVSALTLGAGGSGGREGPIARIGAGVGSSLGQLCNLSAENTRLLLAAGIAGGIGATFGAPIGGILFGLEIVMMYRIKLYNVLVLAETTVISVGTGTLLAPHFTWFTFLPFPLPEISVAPSDILYVLPYGILMGILASMWVVVLDQTEDRFAELSVPDHLKPIIGALPVGILGIWYAKYGVMGVGYTGLRYAVSNVEMGALLLVGLAMAKLVATQFTIGSGGSGGVFAPTLYIGGLFAVGVHQIAGVFPVSNALVGIVGMAAIFSGAAFAPLTAMFLVAEVFGAYGLVAVLAVPSLISYALSRKLLDASVYTSRLQRKGILADYTEIADDIGPSFFEEGFGDGDGFGPWSRQDSQPSD